MTNREFFEAIVSNTSLSAEMHEHAEKEIALLGNHEDFVLTGYSTVNNMNIIEDEELGSDDGSDDKYISWFENLPRYYTEGNANYLNNWLNGVAPTGIFRCPAELPDERGNGRIPEGWTKVDL